MAEKISTALPPEMVSLVRNAVATGEYFSSGDHPRRTAGLIHKRTLRLQGIAELRQLWQEALHDKMPPGSPSMMCSTALNPNQAIAGAGGIAK
jgi:antitoxin ParD1/3/4